MTIDLLNTQASKIETQDDSVKFSKNILTALKEKRREHNSLCSVCDQKVSLSNLKEIYIAAAESYLKSKKLSQGEFAMAKIHQFIRTANSEGDFEEEDVARAKDDVKEFDINITDFNVEMDLFLELECNKIVYGFNIEL